MRKVIFIGTLHLGLTPKNELRNLLESLQPTLLLVELPEEKSARIHAGHHSDEMIFAVNWAESKNITVGYFDINEEISKESSSEEDPGYKKLVDEQVNEVKAFSWKTLNKREQWEQGKLGEIERELTSRYFDAEKWKKREREMFKNIKNLIPTDGVVVILTGVGHLDFFQKELPTAEFPLRD